MAYYAKSLAGSITERRASERISRRGGLQSRGGRSSMEALKP
jgi:hypothetical protein